MPIGDRDLIATVTDTHTGADPTPTAGTADDHYFLWFEGAVLEVRNDHADTACIVTVYVNDDADGNTKTDLAVSVPAGESRRIGPFRPSLYRATDVSSGPVYVDLGDNPTSQLLGVTTTPRVS